MEKESSDHSAICREDRNWDGANLFYKQKFRELDDIIEGGVKLLAEDVRPDHADIQLAPFTNSVCESCNAESDARMKTCGGSSSIRIISDKQVVEVNKFLLFEELFRWARNSEEPKAWIW